MKIDTTKIIMLMLCCALFAGCSMKQRELTVADIERQSKVKALPVATKKSVEENVEVDIYQAYTSYVQQVEQGDHFRSIAISRLADLELEAELGKVTVEDDPLSEEQLAAKKEALTGSRLERTLQLLEMSLRDHPDSSGNDEVLYRVAMISSQLGQHEKSVDALDQLIQKHPGSRFYLEAQFRVAEDSFVVGDYEDAALRYSKVIDAPDNLVFFEKAYFKRGWSKFKLQEYLAAVDDLMVAAAYRDATSDGSMEQDEHFSAYYYAMALNFSYLEDHRALADYFRKTRSSYFSYHIYAELSDIYLAQKRYTDVVAVLKQFATRHPGSRYLPQMELRVVTTWERSGFFDNFYAAADSFYKRFNPDAHYWKGKKRSVLNEIRPLLRANILSIASYYHNQYQSTSSDKSFELASQWYERYLAHYTQSAMADNVYYAYADLLAEEERYAKAIGYYELVAYSLGEIVDQRAAYGTIVLAERLYSRDTENQASWRARYIKYALLFRRTYPDDMRSARIVLRAAEMAFAGEQYSQAVNIASLLDNVDSKDLRFEVGQIKAESYFKLSRFIKAEVTFLYLTRSLVAGDPRKNKLEDRLALTLYKQAELERAAGNDAAARKKFERIAALAGKSEIAPKGLYDAITLAMASESWLEVIKNGGRFRSQFPEHERRNDVTKILSVAYINARQHANAAQMLEEIYEIEQDNEVKMAALWQAAELYESLNDIPTAVRIYQRYVENHQEPFPQYMEALSKLTIMSDAMGDTRRGDIWAGTIRKADHQINASVKTDRTNHIAAIATIRLGREKKAAFDSLKIGQPLKVHLKKKKDAMDWARKLFTTAYEYRSPEVMSESLFSIAEMYYGFSQDVLSSARPQGLNEDEMEQYEIGLEDLAFPVEEKAIEIYESNLAHLNQGVFNDWSKKTFARLSKIFPARYARQVKVDAYVE